MNEEKKLTDEEIVKALDICYGAPCCTSECPYFNKNGRNFCVEDKAFYKDMKRIVQEHSKQKAEIERLTEELEIAKGTKNRLTIFDRIEIHDKAVKDTANKVYKGLCERKNWNDMKEAIRWGDESEELKALISKIVGVEVE